VEAERDVLLAAQQVAAPAPAAMLLDIKGIGPEFAAILWSEGCKIARNNDPLRGDFASNSDPS
jgi:transposase